MTFTGCTSADKECKVVKKKDMTVTTTFTANQNSKSVRFQMIANLGGIEIPVPDLKSDACAIGAIKCPLVKGQVYNFTYTFNLPAIIPNVS